MADVAAASSMVASDPDCSTALSACIVSSTCSCGAGSSAVIGGASSSNCLASASPEAHLRWKAIDVGRSEERSAKGVAVAKERGFDENEVDRKVRTRNAVRRN